MFVDEFPDGIGKDHHDHYRYNHRYDHQYQGVHGFVSDTIGHTNSRKNGINGKYKIDARFNKVDLIKRIEKIAANASKIRLLGMDALDLIHAHKTDQDERSLIYLDPPYFNKGSQLYRNFYTPEDHREISDAITSLKTPWLVTYDNCEPIQALYKRQKSTTFSLTYSTHTARPTATELMVYGNLLVNKEPALSKSTRPYPRVWDTAA